MENKYRYSKRAGALNEAVAAPANALSAAVANSYDGPSPVETTGAFSAPQLQQLARQTHAGRGGGIPVAEQSPHAQFTRALVPRIPEPPPPPGRRTATGLDRTPSRGWISMSCSR